MQFFARAYFDHFMALFGCNAIRCNRYKFSVIRRDRPASVAIQISNDQQLKWFGDSGNG